jgi:putative zinc finger protein
MMALCSKIRLLLGPFDDGELGPHEMEEVAFHLVECVSCKASLDDYRSLGETLRTFAPTPSLDGFVQAVTARLKSPRSSWRERLSDFWKSLGAFGSALEVAGVAAVAAMVTLVVAEPYARRINFDVGRHPAAPQVAQAQPDSMTNRPMSQRVPDNNKGVDVVNATGGPLGQLRHADAIAARESEEFLSEIGGGTGPSVAVWNEPRTDTTVVWVPDQR